MKLQQFDGGLHIRPEPQFLQVTEGRVFENIDTNSSVLKSVKTPSKTGFNTQKFAYWYEAGGRWVSSDAPRDYVEYEGVLYYTSRYADAAPQRMINNGTSYQLGLQIATTPTVTTTLAPSPVKEVKVEAATAASGIDLKDQYYIIINEDTSMQSAALHILVNSQGRVSTIAQTTADPQIYPQIDTTPTSSTTKRVVGFSAVQGVTAGTVGFRVYRQYQGVFRHVGFIPATGSLLDVVNDISTQPVLVKEKFGALLGTYQYLTTYYDNDTGNEGPPSDPSSEIDLTNGGYTTLTALPYTDDPQVTHIRIYRVGGNLGVFTLVDMVTKSTTTYTDNKKDVDLSGKQLDTTNAGRAPSGMKYLQQAYAMLFGAWGTQLRFTPIGYPDRWPADYYLQFEAEITGLAPVSNGLLVFTRFKTYIVTGTGPTSLSQYLLSSDQGCISFDSVQMLGTQAVWVSLDGVCVSSGDRPIVVTKEKMGKLVLDPVDSAIYDEVYYVIEGNKSILALENGIIKRFNLDVDTLAVANDILYGWRNGYLWQLFNSEFSATFSWTSARLTEGSLTTQKTYKKIFTHVNGRVTINILINDKLVQSQVLEGTDSFTVQIPQPLQRGFYIQFQVTGVGTVSEIEYEIGS